MQGINKVILVGNCGKDAESKTLADGTMVAKIAIATTETFRMKNVNYTAGLTGTR